MYLLLMAVISVLTAGFRRLPPLIGHEKENVLGGDFCFPISYHCFYHPCKHLGKKEIDNDFI